MISNASGTSIDLSDSAAYKNRSIGLIGNTMQESTTGKNKINCFNPLTVTGNTNIPCDLPAGTYTISCSKAETTGTTDYMIQAIYDDDTSGYFTMGKTSLKATATFAKQVKTIKMYSQNGYQSSSGVTTTFYDLMIRESSITDDTYEPYTGGIPAPNPNYEMPIKNTGDNVNLFDKDNASILNTAIDANGTGSNSPSTYRTVYIPCKANTIYTVSKKFDATKNRFAVAYTETEPTYNMQVNGYISDQNKSELTIATGANAKYLLAYVWIVGGALTVSEILNSIKVEEGNKATPYSPYGCGNVNDIVQNKDFLKIENIIASINTIVTNGVVKQITADTSFTWKFNCYNDNTFVKQLSGAYKNTIGILEKTFTKDSTFNNIVFGLNGSQKDTLVKINLSNLPDGDYVLSFDITNITQGSISWEDIQVEQGSTATEYQPHEEQNISFPLAEGQKFMEGDYLADDGVHHVVREKALLGNEQWAKYQDYYFYSGNVLASVNDTYLKSNMYSTTNPVAIGTMAEFVQVTANDDYKIGSQTIDRTLRVKDIRFTTVEQFTAWLAEQYANGTPVKVQYELEQEVIDPYTEEQQAAWEQIKALRTYKPVTHISSEDETPATVEIEYVVDTKTYIDNKVTALTNAITSLGGNV